MAVDSDTATDPPPADPPERDADASSVVSSRGQPLVPVPKRRTQKRPKGVPAGPQPETREYRSIEDVVARHREPSAPPVEPPPPRAPPDVYTADDPVPPEEPDPARRDRATYGPIRLMPEAYDPEAPLPTDLEAGRPHSRDLEPPEPTGEKLRTIEDLCAVFDFDGTGQFYIMVTRQHPRAWNSTATYGRMKNIVTSMGHEEFCLVYGGGQYMLQVYGPPKSGKIIDPVTREPKKRPLSRAITLTIPWEGENSLPPNPMAALDPYEGQEELFHHQPRDIRGAITGRRVNTLADAKMLETEVQKELTMDERNRAERRADQEEQRRTEVTALSAIKESKDETIRMLREEIDSIKRENRAASGKQSNGSELVSAVTQMATALQAPRANDDELSRMKESYEDRLLQQRESYEGRIKDMNERHARAIEDRERVLQRDKEDGIRRAEEQARLAEQHRVSTEQQLIKDRDREREDYKKDTERVKADHQRELDSVKRDHERDIARQKEQYENLLRAEKDSNERERRTTEQLSTTRAELVKTSVESELRTASANVTRLEAEVARLNGELAKKGNLPKQLKEAREVAESLGFSKDEGGGREEPQSWQELLLKSGLTVAEKIPEILENAGKLIEMRNAQGRPPTQQRQAAPQQMGPPVMFPPPERTAPAMPPVTHSAPVSGWATEDSLHVPTPMPADLYGGTALPAPAQMQHPTSPPSPGQVAMAAPPPQSAHPTAPPAPRRAPPPAASAPPPPAVVQIADEEILQFAPVVEEWLTQDGTPEDYARGAAAQLPQLKTAAEVLTPEAIAAVLRKHGKGLSPLVRRDGQRFLKRFRDELLRLARGEQAPAARSATP